MHRNVLLLAILMMSVLANAQKKHFVYIQTEDKQPFYVMLNNKNYSSSLSGYLVIPKLKNGRYFFMAGFPKDLYPEQKFSLVVEDKDLGYSLKRFGDKGWGLFDYVSFKTIMANPTDWEKDKAVYDTVNLNVDEAYVPDIAKPTTASSTAKSTSTPAVVNPPTAKTDAVTTEPSKIITNSQSATNNGSNSIGLTQQSPVPVSTISSSIQGKLHVSKTYDRSNSQGIDQVYVDYMPTGNDTISIFIPYAEQVDQHQPYKTSSSDTSKRNTVGNSNQYNRSCVHLATDDDYAKIRKLMSYETTDERMITSAKRLLKNKCITTEQVKSLGLLFLSEQNRYKFFVAAKPFIYDVFNYPSLETEFRVGNMIDQFRKSAN